jgi:hypothetical protein
VRMLRLFAVKVGRTASDGRAVDEPSGSRSVAAVHRVLSNAASSTSLRFRSPAQIIRQPKSNHHAYRRGLDADLGSHCEIDVQRQSIMPMLNLHTADVPG